MIGKKFEIVPKENATKRTKERIAQHLQPFKVNKHNEANRMIYVVSRDGWFGWMSLDEVDFKREVTTLVTLNHPEPDPIKNDKPAIWDLVIQDMIERDREASKKYGTRLQPFNGRNALVDAYQEALDLVVYLRQAIFELTGE